MLLWLQLQPLMACTRRMHPYGTGLLSHLYIVCDCLAVVRVLRVALACCLCSAMRRGIGMLHGAWGCPWPSLRPPPTILCPVYASSWDFMAVFCVSLLCLACMRAWLLLAAALYASDTLSHH